MPLDIYCTSYRLNMFRALLCPSSEAHDYNVDYHIGRFVLGLLYVGGQVQLGWSGVWVAGYSMNIIYIYIYIYICIYISHTHTHTHIHTRCAFVGVDNNLYKMHGTYTKIDNTKFYTHRIPELNPHFSSAHHKAQKKIPYLSAVNSINSQFYRLVSGIFFSQI